MGLMCNQRAAKQRHSSSLGRKPQVEVNNHIQALKGRHNMGNKYVALSELVFLYNLALGLAPQARGMSLLRSLGANRLKFNSSLFFFCSLITHEPKMVCCFKYAAIV